MDRLFVYGIFLSEGNRKRYEMTNPEYATVKDYLTYGSHIVTAVAAPGLGLALTGLLVNMPSKNWPRLDALEGGYKRIEIITEKGIKAFMYVGRSVNDEQTKNSDS